LKGLANLEALAVNGSHISDAGLGQLTGLPKLKELYLAETDITDAGLAHVKTLSSLEFLELMTTRITEDGLVQGRAIPGIRFLALSLPLTDTMLDHLKAMPKLVGLEFEQQLNDGNLPRLAEFSKLNYLWLYYSHVSDDGLKQLKVPPGLTGLRIENMPV